MTVEALVSLSAAWKAHSPALLAFGGDSAIELLSAAVVYWRFRSKLTNERTEKLAAGITGSLLFTLAAYVALVAALALFGHSEVRPQPGHNTRDGVAPRSAQPQDPPGCPDLVFPRYRSRAKNRLLLVLSRKNPSPLFTI
jgi:hypothetical protein